MRELKDLTVKGMALVKSPANRKRFLMHKSEGSSVEQAQSDALAAAPESVVKAVRSISLAKGENEQSHDALEAVAHLLHANPELTLADVLAAGQAAGLSDVEKAAPKKANDDEEDEEDWDDESDDESDDEDVEEEEDASKKGHPSLPPEINRKVKARKSEQENSVADTNNSQQREFVSKSEYDEMVQRVANYHERIEKFEQKEALSVEKSANQGLYADLKIDHDALARTTLALRKSAPKDLEALETTLKAANEQVRVAKSSGGSLFRASSTQPWVDRGVAKSQNDAFKQLVDDYMGKNASATRSQAIAAVAKSADAVAQYTQSQTEV